MGEFLKNLVVVLLTLATVKSAREYESLAVSEALARYTT